KDRNRKELFTSKRQSGRNHWSEAFRCKIISEKNITMDFKRFFRTLKRNIWLLISVPVLAGGLTYYLVQDLPQEYKSQALISTGLSDQVTVDDAPSNYMVQNQRFNNIIESLFMKKNLNSLSYKLILHD